MPSRIDDFRQNRKPLFGAHTLNLRAFTWRRTPRDVDGTRWDVPCLVGVPLGGGYFAVRFDDGDVRERHGSNLYATPVGVPILRPDVRKDFSMGFWWVNDNGTAERPASRYELARAMLGDCPPSFGWTLLDGESVVVRKKALPIGAPVASSEIEEEETARKVEALRVRRLRRRDHAAMMLAKHERAEARHGKLATKWRVILKRTEKAIEES